MRTNSMMVLSMALMLGRPAASLVRGQDLPQFELKWEIKTVELQVPRIQEAIKESLHTAFSTGMDMCEFGETTATKFKQGMSAKFDDILSSADDYPAAFEDEAASFTQAGQNKRLMQGLRDEFGVSTLLTSPRPDTVRGIKEVLGRMEEIYPAIRKKIAGGTILVVVRDQDDFWSGSLGGGGDKAVVKARGIALPGLPDTIVVYARNGRVDPDLATTLVHEVLHLRPYKWNDETLGSPVDTRKALVNPESYAKFAELSLQLAQFQNR